MALTSPAFNCLWQTDQIRETLFELLSKEDMCNVRRTSSACCNLVTKRLFKRTHLSFTATSFTRQSRVQALARIGHHIEHLTFHFPHSEATFLPPLVHPDSGREISFLYKPHTSIASVLERPKFANSGLGHVLTEQYPPLFHAASNVPAFIHAAKHLVNLRHLTIRTPGQDPKERYRRDIVDYALISLRIAIERCPLARLSKLSLVSVHPAAFMYLSHMPGGFGSLPSASRRWRQIRRMSISVEAWDFYSASPGLDHLKMMEDFIRSFSPSLEKLSFTWLGRKGPCPLSLATDPLFAPPRCSQKLFHEVTSPMSPLPPAPARKPVVLPRARYLAVRNATMNERQVADLVSAHQYNVREFDFENVVLINAGSWDAALAPLLQHPCTKDNWSRYSSATLGDTLESILSLRGDDGAATLSSPADLSGHSAAVAALSRELLDMSIGLDDGELLDDDYDDDDDDDIVVDQQTLARPDLDSDLEAARQASVTDLCKQKKRRVTKRRRRRKDGHHERAAVVTEDEAEAEQEKDFLQRLRDTKAEVSKGLLTREHSFFRRIRHRKAASADASVGSGSVAVMPGTPVQSPVQSPSPSPRPARPVRHRTGAKSASSSPLIPSSPPPLSFHMPPIPATTYPPQVRLFGEVQRVHSLAPSTCSGSSSTSPGRLFGEIAGPRDSASLLGSEPDLYNSATDDADSLAEDPFSRPETPATPATLTPHRYFHYNHHYNSYNKTSHNNNDSSSTIKISSPILGSQPSMPILLQPAVYDPTAELCSQISAVQRDLAAEEAHRVYAEDVDMQTNALRKARELVLSRMGSQQQQNQQQHYDYSNSYGQRDSRKDSLGSTASSSGGFLSSARFREGLFRRGSPGGGSGSSIPQSLRHHMSGHSSLFDHHRSMDVPILFSRA